MCILIGGLFDTFHMKTNAVVQYHEGNLIWLIVYFEYDMGSVRMLVCIGESFLHQAKYRCLHGRRHSNFLPDKLKYSMYSCSFLEILRKLAKGWNNSQIIQCHRTQIKNNFTYFLQSGANLSL